MKKWAQTIVGVFFMAVFPLMGNPALILTWPVIYATLAGSMVHLAAPYTSVFELRGQNPRDRGSTYFMIITACLFFTLCIVDFAYISKRDPSELTRTALMGYVLAGLGLAMRQWTIHVLGHYFTARVKIHDEHQIIEGGPYRYLKIRHPSYLGTFLVALGISMILRSWIGFGIFVGGMIPAYLYRIEVEENALNDQVGTSYQGLRDSTWKLFPYIF